MGYNYTKNKLEKSLKELRADTLTVTRVNFLQVTGTYVNKEGAKLIVYINKPNDDFFKVGEKYSLIKSGDGKVMNIEKI